MTSTIAPNSSLPIPESRQEIYRYYRLAFDDNGCPMQETAHGKVFHPILPTYLICDYVLEYERTKDSSFLRHAESILAEALRHADHLDDALVFFYRPETGLTQHSHQFYSALTQAWYVKAITDLARYGGHDLSQPLKKFFRSFLIPVDQSGVLIERDYGWILEEYPSRPALYTLNGWLSVLRMLIAARESLTQVDDSYGQLVTRNLDALAHMLPLYDAEFCLNSRYQLTGFSRLRLVFDRPVDYKLQSFSIDIPGEGNFPGSLERQTNYRWENYIERQEKRLIQFNIVLSLISWPLPNTFNCQIDVSDECNLTICLAEGDYRPDVSAMPTERWIEIGRFRVGADCPVPSQVFIPVDGKATFAYPTNFKKKIGSQFFNAYHFLHIRVLSELFAFSGREIFRTYAQKWLEYYEKWPDCAFLSGDERSLQPYKYGHHFRSVIDQTLACQASTADR